MNPPENYAGEGIPLSYQNQLQLQRPLGIGKESRIIRKPSLPPRPRRMPKLPRQQKEPVTFREQDIKPIRCDTKGFKELVQRLTGKQTSTYRVVSPVVNVNMDSIGKTRPRKNDCDAIITQLLEVGKFPGIPPPTTPIALDCPVVHKTPSFVHDGSPFLSNNNFTGSQSDLESPMGQPSPTTPTQSFALAAPYDFSQVPYTDPLMHDVSPIWSETSFLGSSSGLHPSRIASPASLNLAPAIPELAMQDDLRSLWSEYSLLGSPSRLQPWSMASPPGISSEPFMQELGPLWSEDSFTG